MCVCVYMRECVYMRACECVCVMMTLTVGDVGHEP